MADEREVLENIESEAARVVRGYPLAAGLTSVSDVIAQLPPMTSLSSTALLGPQAAGDPELASLVELLAAPEPATPELVQQREALLREATRLLQPQMQLFANTASYGGLTFPAPSSTPSSSASLSAQVTSTCSLVEALSFPSAPANAPAESSRPAAPRSSESDAFFDSFLAARSAEHESAQRRRHKAVKDEDIEMTAPSYSATPSQTPNKRMRIEVAVPVSSPDSLLLGPGQSAHLKRSRSSDVHSPLHTNGAATPMVESPLKRHKSSDKDRLMELLDDHVQAIFEADDSFVQDTSSNAIGVDGATTTKSTTLESLGGSQPIVSAQMLHNFRKTLTMVAKHRSAKLALVQQVKDEPEPWLRLLRIFARSWDDVEGGPLGALQDRWVRASKTRSAATPRASAKKGKKARKGKVTPSKQADEDAEMLEGENGHDDTPSRAGTSRSPVVSRTQRASRSRSRSPAPADDSADNYSASLDFIADISRLEKALLSIQTALTFLTLSSHIPKQFFSVDFLLTLLTTLRGMFESVIIPILEVQSGAPLEDAVSMAKKELESLCETLLMTLNQLAALVHQEKMAQELTGTVLYIGTEVFFHEAAPAVKKDEPGAGGHTGAVGKTISRLRHACMSITCALWARDFYEPDGRPWIVEEILAGLAKLRGGRKARGPIKLRNGASIQSVSMLLLQLAQTLPADLDAQMRRALTVDQSVETPQEDEHSKERMLAEASRQYVEPALQGLTESASNIVSFLIQRSCKAGKSTAGSSEGEHKLLLDNLLADALSAAPLPEWPGAELVLSVSVMAFTSSLADKRTSADVNAAKTLALDHLGTIGAFIREKEVQAAKSDAEISFQQAIPELNATAIGNFCDAKLAVLRYLNTDSNVTAQNAAMMVLAALSKDVGRAIVSLKATHDRMLETGRGASAEAALTTSIAAKLNDIVCELWSQPPASKMSTDDGDAQELARRSMESLIRSQPLAFAFDAINRAVLESSHSSSVTFRSKAIKAIGAFVAQDSSLFHNDAVKCTIESRLLDSSAAVRDSALDLIGKYVTTSTELAIEYLPQIRGRITDTGLAVRKRVIKLLRSIYSLVHDEELRAGIASDLIWRVLDDEEGIKDLAVDTLDDLWLRGRSSRGDGTADLANVLVAVIIKSGERQPPMADFIKALIARHAEKGTKPALHQLQGVADILIDRLAEGYEDATSHLVGYIKTVHVLLTASPTGLSVGKAATLLPFLKSATNAEEQLVSEFVLRIFNVTLPSMPKSSSKFARDLQAVLLPMLNKPSPLGGLSSLQEMVACFCQVVRAQTHDYDGMINVFRVVYERLRGAALKMRNSGSLESPKGLYMLICMTSLLCQYGGYDELRTKDPDVKRVVDEIDRRPISDVVFNLLFNLDKFAPQMRQAVLTGFGFLYRAHPRLMLRPVSTTLMDEAWGSGNLQLQMQMSQILLNFLGSQGDIGEHASSGDKVQINELIGNVAGFADTGVASAVCQRYIPRILDAAKSPQPALQRKAVDILASIVRNGFSHPLSLVPTIVALTGCPDTTVATKANNMLVSLFEKHTSLLATRFSEASRAAFDYAVACQPDTPKGHTGEPLKSLLGPLYMRLRDKRVHKLDFLRAMTRAFEFDVEATCSEEDVQYARFVAEALSTLDFKNSEEPMSICFLIDQTLAVSGLQVFHKLNSTTEAAIEDLAGQGDRPSTVPSIHHARQSVIAGLALLLRDYLRLTFGLSDAKMDTFTIGKKTSAGDKPASRKLESLPSLDAEGYGRMPLAATTLETEEQLVAQRDAFLAMVQDDGTAVKGDDDDEDM